MLICQSMAYFNRKEREVICKERKVGPIND